MEVILAFLVLTVFFIITMTVMYGICTKSENFKSENFKSENFKSKNFKNSVARFFTYPLSKYEKINSLYAPIICRPPEHYARTYSGNCTNELYPKSTSPFGKGEMSAPCNPEIEAKYYAMRPLLTPQTYNKMIQEIFSKISTRFSIEESTWYPNEFCNKNCYSNIMKFIMKNINEASKEVFSVYSKSDTWGGEQFAFLNEKIFSFTTHEPPTSEQEQAHQARYNLDKGPKKHIVSFTLHNTLRSSSIDCIALVYQENGKFVLSKIEFSTKSPSKWVDGVEISKSINLNNQNLPPEQNKISWIYGNNIENTTFNLKGFHDPDESKNILIPGGVPSEFKEILKKCDQGYLLTPSGNQGPRFKGAPFGTNNANKAPPVRTQSEIWEVNV